MNLNQTNLIGRVTRDPELKSLPSGAQVCSFGLATNRVWNDKDGNKQEDTTFHNLTSFGKQAETIAKYVVKGQLFFVTGRLQTRSWDDKETGKKMYRTEIIIENFQFGPKAGEGGGKPYEKKRSQADEDFDHINDEPGDGKFTMTKPSKKASKTTKKSDEESDNIDPDEIPF